MISLYKMFEESVGGVGGSVFCYVGWTSLMFAAGAGDEKTVKLLLGKKPGVDIKNSFGRSAAQIAADNEHGEIADLLKKTQN